MRNLNFLINWYHKENERRDSLNRSLNIPIGILTGLFLLIFFVIKEFKILNDYGELLNYSFFILLGLAVITWIIVVINLFGSYNNFFSGYTYKAIPYPTTLDEHYLKLENFVIENKKTLDSELSAESLYEKQFHAMLSEYLNRNINNNDLKSAYLFRGKKYLILCFTLVLLSCIPFTINFITFNRLEDSIQIGVIKNSESPYSNQENERRTKKTDSSTTSTSPVDKRGEQTNSTTTNTATADSTQKRK